MFNLYFRTNFFIVLKLLSYQTNSKYRNDFTTHYTVQDFNVMRLLSFSGFFIALISRLFGFFYLDKITAFPAYAEFSVCNLVMIIGNFLFYLTSFYNFKSLEIKRLLTLIFAAFLLLSTLYVSYVNSMHNTKNTLTMVLVGVFLTGIFLTLEKKQIVIMALLLFFSF